MNFVGDDVRSLHLLGQEGRDSSRRHLPGGRLNGDSSRRHLPDWNPTLTMATRPRPSGWFSILALEVSVRSATLPEGGRNLAGGKAPATPPVPAQPMSGTPEGCWKAAHHAGVPRPLRGRRTSGAFAGVSSPVLLNPRLSSPLPPGVPPDVPDGPAARGAASLGFRQATSTAGIPLPEVRQRSAELGTASRNVLNLSGDGGTVIMDLPHPCGRLNGVALDRPSRKSMARRAGMEDIEE